MVDEANLSKAVSALGDQDAIKAWAFQFALLGTPARLALIVCLAEAGPISVSDIATAIGHQPDNVSHSLSYLHKHGIVCSARDGPIIRYTLTDAVTRRLLEELRTRPVPPTRVQRRSPPPFSG